jgi:hypothetical protein
MSACHHVHGRQSSMSIKIVGLKAGTGVVA